MNEERQLIAPYEGEEAYIFVSYSHRNKDDALSIVERLQGDGYRVWYDEGIHPGSEWDEYIARYVANCTLFLALLSDDYLRSSNCKDELNYARNKEKNRVLIYLEDIELPAGMELRLSRLQNIHKHNYAYKNDFYEKLYTSAGIEKCHSIDEVDTLPFNPYLYNATNHEEIRLEYGTYLIGRDSRKCRICIDDNKASLVHAILTVSRDVVSIKDLNSTNRVSINGKPIDPNTEYRIRDQDSILIGNTELRIVYIFDFIDPEEQEVSSAIEILETSKETLLHNAELVQGMSSAYEEIGEKLGQGYFSRAKRRWFNRGILENSINTSSGDNSEKNKSKKGSNQKTITSENIYYFGAKKAEELFKTIPEVLVLPKKTDIVLADAFRHVPWYEEANVKTVVIPKGVREIQDGAFQRLIIQETIIIPDTVNIIGEEAFCLAKDAYVTCSAGSRAYGYCKQNNIKNTVDIAIWEEYGKCRHCGGNFTYFTSSFGRRRCKNCGRVKDY